MSTARLEVGLRTDDNGIDACGGGGGGGGGGGVVVVDDNQGTHLSFKNKSPIKKMTNSGGKM